MAGKRQTTAADRKAIFFAIRSSSHNGRLKRGIQGEVARQLGFEIKTISRQWTAMNKKLAPLVSNQPPEEHAAIISQNEATIFGVAHASRKKGKYKYDRTELMAALKLIPLKKRRTVRKCAGQLSIPSSTLQHILRPKDAEHHDVGVAVRYKSKLKPTLTEMNKVSRFNFALEQVNTTRTTTRNGVNSKLKYYAQMDKVHVDEKWFYLCRDGENYILAGDEPPPERHVKHKNFIGKVMFLCAQARPRWDPATNSMW